MIRRLMLAGLAAGFSGPAVATEWLYCSDAASTVTSGLLLGATEVLSVAGIVLSHGDTVWASDPAFGPGEPISVGQGFENEIGLSVDLMDGGFAKLAELRLVKAAEGTELVYAGTLRLPGRGVWAVTCEGP